MRDYVVVGVALMIVLAGAHYAARAFEQDPPGMARHTRAPASPALQKRRASHHDDREEKLLRSL